MALETTSNDFESLLMPVDWHGTSQSDSDLSLSNSTNPSLIGTSTNMSTNIASLHQLDKIYNDSQASISNFKRKRSKSQISGTNDFLYPSSALRHKTARPSSSFGVFDSSLATHTSETFLGFSSEPKLGSRGDSGTEGKGCSCYHSILRCLSKLHENSPSNINITFDQMVKIEKDVRIQVSVVLECRRCSDNSSLLILLSVLLENIVELLEGINFGDVHQTDHKLGSEGSVQGTRIKSTALKLGTYEIDGEEKADFMKNLLNQRLQRLATTIREVHGCMHKNAGKLGVAFNQKINTILMADIYQRLLVVICGLDI